MAAPFLRMGLLSRALLPDRGPKRKLKRASGAPGGYGARRGQTPYARGRAQTLGCAPQRPATFLLGLLRAQTCCIMACNGNGFLHEEGVCYWAMHGCRKG